MTKYYQIQCSQCRTLSTAYPIGEYYTEPEIAYQLLYKDDGWRVKGTEIYCAACAEKWRENVIARNIVTEYVRGEPYYACYCKCGCNCGWVEKSSDKDELIQKMLSTYVIRKGLTMLKEHERWQDAITE